MARKAHTLTQSGWSWVIQLMTGHPLQEPITCQLQTNADMLTIDSPSLANENNFMDILDVQDLDDILSYETLLQIFWDVGHQTTTISQQIRGNDQVSFLVEGSV